MQLSETFAAQSFIGEITNANGKLTLIADLDCENLVSEDLAISFLSSMMEMNLENCFESMHSESNKGFKMNSLSAEHTKCEYVTALMSSKFLSIGIHFSPSLAIYVPLRDCHARRGWKSLLL